MGGTCGLYAGVCLGVVALLFGVVCLFDLVSELVFSGVSFVEFYAFYSCGLVFFSVPTFFGVALLESAAVLVG